MCRRERRGPRAWADQYPVVLEIRYRGFSPDGRYALWSPTRWSISSTDAGQLRVRVKLAGGSSWSWAIACKARRWRDTSSCGCIGAQGGVLIVEMVLDGWCAPQRETVDREHGMGRDGVAGAAAFAHRVRRPRQVARVSRTRGRGIPTKCALLPQRRRPFALLNCGPHRCDVCPALNRRRSQQLYHIAA